MDDFVTEFDGRAGVKSREACERIEREDAERRSKLSERERQIIDMWPRFEDGEYVWFGDAVEAHHGGAITVEAIEFSRGSVCVKDAADGDWGTSMYAMHPLKRPAPEVLDGRDEGWLREMCVVLGRCIREIGDQLGIVCGDAE